MTRSLDKPAPNRNDNSKLAFSRNDGSKPVCERTIAIIRLDLIMIV